MSICIQTYGVAGTDVVINGPKTVRRGGINPEQYPSSAMREADGTTPTDGVRAMGCVCVCVSGRGVGGRVYLNGKVYLFFEPTAGNPGSF